MNELNKPNARAYKSLVKNLNILYPHYSQDQKKVILSAIGSFINESGFNIGKVIKVLETQFSKEEAEKIATSETTRIFALSAIEEGRETKKEWPDVSVVKTWFTCNDNCGCGPCKSLEGKTVDLEDYFDVGKKIFMPPACDSCRCWIDTNTQL